MILRRRLETPKFRLIILIRVVLRRCQKPLKTLLVMMPLPRSRTIPRVRMIILVRGVLKAPKPRMIILVRGVLKAPKPRMMVLVRGVLRRCQRLFVTMIRKHSLSRTRSKWMRKAKRLLVVLYELHGLDWSGWNNLMASLDPAASVRAPRSK